MPPKMLVAVATIAANSNLTPEQATMKFILETHQSADAVSRCAVCKTLTTFTCGVCHGICYCSADHEHQDAPNHQSICNAAQRIPLQPSAGETWIAVLVFPEHSRSPYYQWINYTFNKYNLPTFDQTAFYGEGYRSKPRWITRHPVTRQHLGTAIMYFQQSSAVDGLGERDTGTTTNLCAYNCAAGIDPVAFKGPMLFMGYGRTLSEDTGVADSLLSFKPEEIHLVVHDLKAECAAPGAEEEVAESVQAVVVYPQTTTDGKQTTIFESLDIPKLHPIFNKEDPRVHQPTFAESYMFPIRTFTFSNYPAHLPRGNEFIRELFPAVKIVKDGDDSGEGNEKDLTDLGRPVVHRPTWSADDIGAVLIARRDFKPLEVLHVKRFVEFSSSLEITWANYGNFRKSEIEKKKKDKEDKSDGNPSKVLQQYTDAEEFKIIDAMYSSLEREAFMDFWEEYVAKGDGKGDADCVSPFEGIKRKGPNTYEKGQDMEDPKLVTARKLA
ncbi:hypothetical protein ABW20_dc0103203 [Dactylellina cionopaga]|nr:hypothetical protein ABW20_dc0103203 [Dactylellina cionopaga]